MTAMTRLLLSSIVLCASAFTPPPGWTETPLVASRSLTKNVTFVLPLDATPAELEALVARVSYPSSPDYARFWSAGDVNNFFRRPVPDALKSYTTNVLKWNNCYEGRGTWNCDRVPVIDIEAAWDVGFAGFIYEKTRMVSVRATRGPDLPAAIASIIDFVAGLGTTVPDPNPKTRPSVDNSADPQLIPQTFVNTYEIPSGRLGPNVSIGAIEFQDYPPFFFTDLQMFASGLGIEYCPPTVITGAFDNSTVGDESALDAATISGLSCGATIYYDTQPNWIWDYAHGRTDPASVHPQISSISYGWSEQDQCSVDSAACTRYNITSCGYVQRCDMELGLTALLGQTHVVASGDSGCHGRTDMACSSPECFAAFPGISTFVTSVSATAALSFKPFGPGDEHPPICVNTSTPCAKTAIDGPCYPGAPHTGCFWCPGGSGGSVCLARPAYQQAAVHDYEVQTSLLPPSADFGFGSAGPDVAGFGHNFYLPVDGEWQDIDGTSASTPLFASLLAHVAHGLGHPIGFANPALYALGAGHPEVFHKITDANNYCTEAECCDTGFNSSTSGWDAVTGWGTMNVTAAIAAWRAL